MSEGHIEVIIEDIQSHPQCPHGPTILFSRNVKGIKKSFYACAASRDRKQCKFFLSAEKISSFKKDIWERESKRELESVNHCKMIAVKDDIMSGPPSVRSFCHRCNKLYDERRDDQHENHEVSKNLTDYNLKHPTEILPALENSRKEAQYLFSISSVKVLVDVFQTLGYKNIICIGTPRIHEYIQNHCLDIKSILLDMDKRFHNFFGPLQYCWYNMFNHHFFFKEARQNFRDFLQSNNGKETMLVTDPPFGGRTELISATLNTINEEYKTLNNLSEDLPVFWVYPYFMEPQIRNAMPEMRMLDYKVEYENHSLFHNGSKGGKKGSPVRVFTNVSLSLIKLPRSDYKYCNICEKWVANENQHCPSCDDCTSKNGLTYVHCFLCERCVKPTWKHCEKCTRCAQKEHICKELVFQKECFNCKQTGHKKADCPKNSQIEVKKRTKEAKSKAKKKRKN